MKVQPNVPERTSAISMILSIIIIILFIILIVEGIQDLTDYPCGDHRADHSNDQYSHLSRLLSRASISCRVNSSTKRLCSLSLCSSFSSAQRYKARSIVLTSMSIIPKGFEFLIAAINIPLINARDHKMQAILALVSSFFFISSLSFFNPLHQ